MPRQSNAIKKEKEVAQNPDPRIDQDYPGFPHPPSGKKNITPEKESEKKTAGVVPKKTNKTYGH